MANVVSLDEFTGEWYPGFKPEFLEGPYIVDGTGPFTARGRGPVLVPRLPLDAGPHPARRVHVGPRRLLLGHPARRREPAAAPRPRRDVPVRRHPPLRLGRSRRPTPARSAPAPTGSARTCRTSCRTTAPSGTPAATSSRPPGTTSRRIDLTQVPTGDLPGLVRQAPPVPQALDGDPLRRHVPDAGELPRVLRRLRRDGHRHQPDRQVPPGRGHQDHGDRPRALPARDQGQADRPRVGVRAERRLDAARRAVPPRRRRRRSGSPTSTTSCRSTATARRPPATSACPPGWRTTRSPWT